MSTAYLHGDVAEPSAFTDGVEAERFYDFRLRQFVVVDWETTIASHDDLWVLKRQLQAATVTRPPGTTNVFAAGLGQRLWRRKSRKHGEQELAALERRRVANEALMVQLRCAHCGSGRLHHADGKCLFDATEWKPGK